MGRTKSFRDERAGGDLAGTAGETDDDLQGRDALAAEDGREQDCSSKKERV
jgi:hypothetical protein